MAQESRRSGMLKALGGLVGFSVIAGILVTAMVTPALAVTSSAAGGAITVFDDLPDYLTIDAQSQQNIVYGTRGGQPVPIATIYNQNRQEVTADQISPFLKHAAVDGEDRRFFDHGGVDVPSVLRAAVGNVTHHGITSGGSTLDMQLVKNILVQQALQIHDPKKQKAAYTAAIDDSLQRKLKEMKLAIGLDKRYTKNQILVAYLNITGFGGNTYGVQSAAQQYFSTDAAHVTVAQAASLVAIVQQPNLQNLGDPKRYPANKVRRDQILNDMYAEKHITKAQLDEAIKTPIAAEVKLTAPTEGCLYALDAKFACDYVELLVPTLPQFGATAKERVTNFAHGGYKLYTSIDLDQQDASQTVVSASAPATETRFHLGAAADAVEPGTGRIIVMAQNKEFNNTQSATTAQTGINLSTDRAFGGSSGFQTGSTYKIFTLTDWLQKGHGLYDSVNGSVRNFPKQSFTACGTHPFTGPTYMPKNDSPGEGGSMSVISATSASVNAAFVGMAQKLDLCDIRDDAKALGVHRADGQDLKYDPSSVLGVNEIAPMTMAAAIATIGANGTYCAPTILDKVVGPDGKDLGGQPRACTEAAIDPTIAATVAFALATVMKSGTGAQGSPRDGVPIVGKTGTTDGSYQNWLIATTTKMALAVWVGNIEGNPAKATTNNPQGDQSLRQITVAGTNGYNTKFNIFRATMKSLNSNPAYRGGAFPTPDPKLLKGTGVSVPNVAGQQVDQATKVLTSLQFDVTVGGAEPSGLPAGQVVRTDPAAGTTASLGASITIFTSDGSLATTMPSVVGLSRADAVNSLVSNGFSKGNVTYHWVPSPPNVICIVTASTPKGGDAAGKDAQVSLTVNSGSPRDGTDPGPVCQ
jgi:membrane peptidoglycan carboxypeptidase